MCYPWEQRCASHPFFIFLVLMCSIMGSTLVLCAGAHLFFPFMVWMCITAREHIFDVRESEPEEPTQPMGAKCASCCSTTFFFPLWFRCALPRQANLYYLWGAHVCFAREEASALHGSALCTSFILFNSKNRENLYVLDLNHDFKAMGLLPPPPPLPLQRGSGVERPRREPQP